MVTLAWSVSADTELPVIGYVINRDDGYGANYRVVYNGKDYPNVLKYSIAGLQTGITYRFTLQAINFNGLSPESEPAKFTVCLVPQKLKVPVLKAVTKTMMDLTWTSPLTDGGCPITSYAIYVDDGNGGAFTEKDATDVNNIPELREHVLNFDAADTSKTFRIYLEATNVIGSVQSDIVSYKLAAPPSKPADPPRLNLDETRSY
jgi:hypothetical protein